MSVSWTDCLLLILLVIQLDIITMAIYIIGSLKKSEQRQMNNDMNVTHIGTSQMDDDCSEDRYRVSQEHFRSGTTEDRMS